MTTIDTRHYCNKCGFKLPSNHGFAKLICGPCVDFMEGRDSLVSHQYINHKQARYQLCTKIVELEKELHSSIDELDDRIVWLVAEIEKKDKKISDLQDFAIWMTGCGYDFTQHDHFNKERDRLILDKEPKKNN